ncbi:MAG: SusC/RagA family TonB-linked outer membrane protein, partial [Candidatus Cryptobacteroides sp.]
AVSAYRSLEKLATSSNGYLFNGSQQASYYRDAIPSPDLTWEKTDLYNLALDMSFFNNRLSVTAEGYISKTRDLLMEVQVASQSGFTSRFTNLGETTNKGFELSIESRNIVKKHFSWTTNFTLSLNRQMVDDIGTSEFVPTATSDGNNPYMMHGFVKGYPLNAVWGFRYAGVWHSVDEFIRNESTHAYVSESTITSNNYASSLGLPKYYDINNDGALDQNDLVYLGNADPDVYGGFQNNFNIYGLNIGIYFSWSAGGKIYNYSELYMAGGNRTNQYSYMANRWHPVRNPDSDLPRAGGTQSASVPSDRMVYDASYFRLKSLSIGYTFDLTGKVKWLRDIKLTASGENLFLWKKYNGFDPDVSSSGDSSTLRRLDLGAYPKARTIVFSVQIRY